MGYPTDRGYNPQNRIPHDGDNPFRRKGWWVNSNSLGDTRQIDMPPTEGAIIDVTSVDALAGPLPYSVTLNRKFGFPDRNVVGANCDVRAQVQFGSGATSRIIVCDWNPGTQLDFAGCGAVRVSAIAYKPIPDLDYSTAVVQPNNSTQTAQVDIGASIGMTGGPHPRPRFTQRLPVIANGNSSAIITPPAWAHAVQLTGGSSEGGSVYVAGITLDWIGPDGLPFARILGTDLNPTVFAPIPATGRIQVGNTTGVNQTVTLIWELAL